MKRVSITLLAIGLILKIFGQQIDAYFDYAPFSIPGQGTYIETYIAIAGNSVFYEVNKDKNLQARIEVSMVFKNADDIVEFRRYNFASPPLPDSTMTFPSFIDQQRIMIPQGIYNFELKVTDLLAPDTTERTYNKNDMITVDIPEVGLSFSGIEFIERYTASENKNIYIKNGYECIPFVSDFFPQEMNNLKFYMEIYNAASELGDLGECLMKIYIKNMRTQKPMDEFSSFQKIKALNAYIVFKDINIRNLPTGNYQLVVDIRDKQNKLIGEKNKFFQRSNPKVTEKQFEMVKINPQETFVKSFVNIDSLKFFVASLQPIADQSETKYIDNLLQNNNLDYLQQFFYNFWLKRNETNPQNDWNDYYLKLLEVQQKYGSKQIPGYATDRGRIYLLYGPPSSLIQEYTEADAYPYEIWHYYNIADQTNKKFIFYNPELSSNNFILLHSNMPGELSDVNWESKLYARTSARRNSRTGSNTKARQLFDGI
jgi:GWxTD domain-containing protein